MTANFKHTRIVLTLVLSLVAGAAFGQGALTPPPGAPSPTMKTLDQVEPRTAITNLPFTINQGGSYYLTQSYAQDFGANAISITTSNVTLDLCGFTVQNTGSQSIDGISLQGSLNVALRNVLVKNGCISGFSATYGIECSGTQYCVFEDLVVSGCGQAFLLQARGKVSVIGNIIRRCRVCDNTVAGIGLTSGMGNGQNLIQNCELLNDGASGMNIASAGNLVINCRASGNTANYIIVSGNRTGAIVQPGTTTTFSGQSGGVGTGTSDPCLNLSY